jgi:hypothetical protein
MALDASIGTDTANSYVDLDYATDYFFDRVHASSWSSFSSQEQVLITSSNVIDWYMNWKGYKTDSNQSMDWPRTDVVLRDGTVLNNDIIPENIKVSVCELALSFFSGDKLADNPLYGLDQVKLGTMMVKSSSDIVLKSSKVVIPDHVNKILADLCVRSSINVVRLVRA